MDISYFPMAHGFVYLAAAIDWSSRRVLAHRVSISMDTAFCVEALEEAIARHGSPEIFNTDQGSQLGFMESSQHRLLQHAPAAVEPSSSNPGRGVLRIAASALGRSNLTP